MNNYDSTFHSVSLSGGSPTDNDSAYCTEIARRSVARAALHLGMEGMEGSAMDALGSVLIGYMDQVSIVSCFYRGAFAPSIRPEKCSLTNFYKIIDTTRDQ